jgi:DNA-binding NarL/FixJ family response regulator
VRIYLVSEHALFAEGLTRLLEELADTEIQTAPRNGRIEPDLAGWRPDVVVAHTADVVSSAGMLRGVVTAAAGIPVLVIAPGKSDQFLAALRVGARGFVPDDTTALDLQHCIDALRRNEWGLPRAHLGALVDQYLALAAAHAAIPERRLTDRERDVLRLLARGWSTQRIGQELYLADGTVRGVLRSLQRKLGVHNRMQLVTEAFRLGLVDA